MISEMHSCNRIRQINPNKMKLTLIIFILVISFEQSFSQSFFKGSKPLLTWMNGDSKAKTIKLKSSAALTIKYSELLVHVQVIFGNQAFDVINIEETNEWTKLQITEYDFDKDGKNELVIAYGDYGTMKVMVSKITKSDVVTIGSFDGQYECVVEKNKIWFPIGSQGLFEEYTLVKNSFVKTQ